MKLVNTFYNIEVDLKEGEITILSVENPVAYRKIIGDIWRQINGEEGSFVLSENGKIKNISKEVECIFNPFSLDFNSKKIITKLYQELKLQADSLLQEETTRLNTQIIEYLDKLIMTVPYGLKVDCDMDICAIMKMYGVELDYVAASLLENFVEYIKVVSKICGIKIFVLVDIKHYLTEDELYKLYEILFYEKITCIIVEPSHTEKLGNENSWIIDKDLCIIDL